MRYLSVPFIATVSTIACTQFALAADLPVKGPVYKAPAAVSDPWTGFYIGGNVGYSWGRSSSDYTSTDPTAGISEANSDAVKINGVIGGGQIGFNYRFNQSYIVGIEADIQASGEKGNNDVQICHASQTTPNGICDFSSITDSYTEKLKWFGTVRGRLGYLVAPTWLLYGTGGLAYGKLTRDDNYTYNSTFFCNSGNQPFCTPQSNSISATKTGWTAGGGVEVLVSGNWFARVEYLHISLDGLGSSSMALTNGNPPLVNLTTVSHRFNDDIVRIGVDYRLGSL